MLEKNKIKKERKEKRQSWIGYYPCVTTDKKKYSRNKMKNDLRKELVKMRKFLTNTIFWEIIGYLTLALSVFGSIAVGYWYLVAEFAFLIANAVSVVRDFALKLPPANIVRDIAFTGITIGLIVIYIW